MGADVERRVGVLGERGALGGGQRGVEHHGDDAAAQRTEDDGKQGRGGGGRDQQPVPRAQARRAQRRCRPSLVALAVRGPDDRDVRHGSRTRSPSITTCPSAASFARVARVDWAAAGHTSRGTSA